jgi:multicomponent Na+:H+ antiporter subunit D
MLEIKLQNFTFLLNFSHANILIFAAMLIVTFATNMYLVRNLKIIGNIYFLFTTFAIFADDYFSIFFSLEAMMICASLLLFQTDHKIAKQYFLTHFFSGSLNLVAIILLFIKVGNMQISNITYLFLDDDKYIIGYLFLLSYMINIASFPFSNWMLNSYTKSTDHSFLYLIIFTTNISIIIVNKLFAGLHLLKFIGLANIIYGSIYGYMEVNYKKIFCYINIITFGMLLIIIGQEQQDMTQIVTLFIFISILYKSLFAFSITMFQEISKFLIIICSILSILIIINIPFTASFLTKTFMTSDINHDIYYHIIYFGKIITNVVLLQIYWKLYSTDTLKINNVISQTSILFLCLVNISINFYIYDIANYLNISNEFINFEYKNHINSQFIIILTSFIISFLSKNSYKFITDKYEIDFFKIIGLTCKKIQYIKIPVKYLIIFDYFKNNFIEKIKNNIIFKYKLNQKDSILIIIILLILFMIYSCQL